MRGRQTESKALVVIAAQQDGKKIGRIRMKQIPDASSTCLQAFIMASIEPGTTVVTDGWTGYLGLETLGYMHKVINLSKRREPASDLLPSRSSSSISSKAVAYGNSSGGHQCARPPRLLP